MNGGGAFTSSSNTDAKAPFTTPIKSNHKPSPVESKSKTTVSPTGVMQFLPPSMTSETTAIATQEDKDDGRISLVISSHNTGVTHFQHGNYTGAMECFRKSLKDHSLLLNRNGHVGTDKRQNHYKSAPFLKTALLGLDGVPCEVYDMDMTPPSPPRKNTKKEENSTTTTTSLGPTRTKQNGSSTFTSKLVKTLKMSVSKRNHHSSSSSSQVCTSSKPKPASCTHNLAEEGTHQRQDKTQYIFQRNEYDEGMHLLSVARPIDSTFMDNTQNKKGATTLLCDETNQAMILSTIYLNIGKVHQKRNEIDDANEMYRRALIKAENCSQFSMAANTTKCCPLKIEILHNLGQLQYYQGNHSAAIKTYHSALTLAKKICGERSVHVASTLNCLGVLRYHMSSAGEENCALDYFQSALSIRRRIALVQGEGDTSQNEHIATTLNNIGRIHFQRGEYDESMMAYNEALSIRKTLFGEFHLDVAATVFNTGQAFHQKGNYDEALRLYKEFSIVAKAKLGLLHRDVAIVTTCIAQIHQERKEYEEAMKLYQEALHIGRAALGDEHPEVAITLNKIGNLQYERGDLDAAISSYREGLKVERVVLEPFNPNIIVTLTNIGEIHKQKEEYDDAMENYQEALSLQKRNLGVSHPDVASTLNSIGSICFQKEDYDEALDYFQEALRMRREFHGDTHVDIAATLTHIGLVLRKRNKQEMAIAVFMESLRIRKAAHEKVNRDVAFTMYNIAMIHHQRGDYEQAMRYYNKTMRVEKHALGEDHPDVAITMYNIGQVHFQCGDLEEALTSFQEALRLERTTLGSDHPSVARTLNDIGNIYLRKGDIREVMEAFTEALRIYKRAGLSVDNLVVVGRNLYAFQTSYPEASGAA